LVLLRVSFFTNLYKHSQIYNYKINLSSKHFDNDYNIPSEIFSEETIRNNEIIDEPSMSLFREGHQLKILTHDKLTDLKIDNTYKHESLLSLATNLAIYDDSLCYARHEFEHFKIYLHIEVGLEAEMRRPVISRYNTEIDTNGQNLVNVLHTLYSENREFENDINTAMRAAFGDDFDRFSFPPAGDQLVQLRIIWKSLEHPQSMLDLSDGTIRFLFLMTVLCNPDPPPLIAIDEPETGLHPSMFPIIAEYAAEASKRTQVIFSTHSPQFLDAFGEYNPTTTVTVRKDGETKIKNLDGDTLKQWLEHYSLGTLFLFGDLEALA
jgi:predicted ATPase